MLTLHLGQMEIKQYLPLAPFYSTLDLGQGKVPVRPSLKIDDHSEEILAPFAGVVFDQAEGEVVLP